MSRMPEPFGSHIDRTKAIRFTFEGKTYSAFAGDTIASALVANDVWVLSRSFKYHRPRGLVSLACCEANTLVTVNKVPNVFAERHLLRESDIIRGQNYVGSLRYDAMGLLRYAARFLSVGFYYRAFFRPRGAWRFWEPFIRRMAGLGEIDAKLPHDYHDKSYRFADVAIVGGGPAGLTAAIDAAASGERVILIDDGVKLGGSSLFVRDGVVGGSGGEHLQSLLTKAASLSNLSILSEATCEGVFSDQWLSVVKGNRLYKVRTKHLVLATGSIDLPSVFRGNDLPGIVLGSAAQRLIRMFGILPGKRSVILTANDTGYAIALDLLDAGSELAAIVDLRPNARGGRFERAVMARKVRILYNRAIHEAIGNHHVKAVDVMDIDSKTVEERIACDLVCVSVGSVPNLALAAQAGALIGYDGTSMQLVASRIPENLQLVGSAAGTGPYNDPYPIFPHPKGKDFVDLDEDLTVTDIEDTIATGFEDIQLLKRYSTLGMGPSQGRHSNVNAIRIAARIRKTDTAAIGTTTFRAPYSGESFGVLAGRSFEPVRRTSMHHRHVELGARIMVAGTWLRPAYYEAAHLVDNTIAAEVRRVRTAVGVIDVSTLGKIDLRGPAAAEFINRLYVTGHLKQAVGRVRYALHTDTTGTIADDGVIARLDERHFFLTATTTGVDSLLRAMYFWNALWRLDVDITNVTSAFSAVNIAGPRSRDLMKALGTDFAIEQNAFPYLTVRSGTVASIPARVMRVGFVGELGYEVHVPSGCGEALWDAVLEAGKAYDLAPFGVEAQRVLRLEKGHVIIGQDTDGLTHPLEIGIAPSTSKPFFVGAAAIAAFRARGIDRRLVGFSIAQSDATIPKESHLVIENGEIAGRVTSCAWSPTLQATIGLAYVRPHQAEAGSTFWIRADRGRMVAAKVANLPFYDANNQRQSA